MSQLDHWAAVAKRHEDLLEFLTWLETSGYIAWVSFARPGDAADRYLEVDRKQLEAERRELLDRQRQFNQGTGEPGEGLIQTTVDEDAEPRQGC